ncbi:MAG: hypothetical protein BGO30_00140 [Bacteroidetes bacterium 41-46]|jgi:hypothetical protein|nr:MAG: hypothetical protein BGO30_00140 [Bacteroidetes bacterium 41-46]
MFRLLSLILITTLFAKISPAEVRREYRELIPKSRVVINYPQEDQYREDRPLVLILYALPNGNTIEETEGRGGPLLSGEWRYNIQHIAAQVRYLRENDSRFNYVIAYLEATQKGWTIHASEYKNSAELYKILTDTIIKIVSLSLPDKIKSEKISVALTSHSGGGRFVLNFIRGVDSIPPLIERISFIDSNYGYETDLHSDKLLYWLRGDTNRYLGVMAYVDTTVVLNGKRIVSSKGGTGYRSVLMADDLKRAGVTFVEQRDTSFLKMVSQDGRVAFWIKENPEGRIYHTILVERNGLIHQMLFGAVQEEKGYEFWGERCYVRHIR